MNTVATLLSQLVPDPWRLSTPFSDEMRAANDQLFTRPNDAREILLDWISRHQPCLFGRLAAKSSTVHVSVLTEADLRTPDDNIAQILRAARLAWFRAARSGRASGHIVLFASTSLAMAEPNDTLCELARTLAGYYLAEAVAVDAVSHDYAYLKLPGRPSRRYRWKAGVNFFGSQGDKRWWHDHRIPGGIALSINSVGHMVRATILTQALDAYATTLQIDHVPEAEGKVSSLTKAVELAMLTIDRAAAAASGRATWLLPFDGTGLATRPPHMPASLVDKDHRQYGGFYHTDYTIPSLYFRSDVMRPHDAKPINLDFSYLIDRRADNPDFFQMAEGIQVQAGGVVPAARASRPSLVDPDEVEIAGDELFPMSEEPAD